MLIGGCCVCCCISFANRHNMSLKVRPYVLFFVRDYDEGSDVVIRYCLVLCIQENKYFH